MCVCCEWILKTHIATVHEESSVPAQPLSRQVEQRRLRNHCVIQMERPLQVSHKECNGLVCLCIYMYIHLSIYSCKDQRHISYFQMSGFHVKLLYIKKTKKKKRQKKKSISVTVFTDTPKQSNFSSVLHPDTFNSLLSDSTDAWGIITSGLVRLLPGQTCCPAGTSQDEPFASAAAAAASWTHTCRRRARPVVCWCLSATLSGKKCKHFL